MASTGGHLWRTTRVNTRKNSTRASVAAVLRAERVRAAQTGAAAAGIASSLAHVGTVATPRTKRVVAFDESVTVHILPADEHREAEFAPSAEDGFCVRCQAFVEKDQRNWKSAFGLGLLRQVDEFESRQGVCRCDETRYPEYGIGGGQVVVYGDDDDDEDEGDDDEDDGDDDDNPAKPKMLALEVSTSYAPLEKKVRLTSDEIPLPPPPAPRERSLRFTSRSRNRDRTTSPTVRSPASLKDESTATERTSSGSIRSNDAKSESFFDAANRDSESMLCNEAKRDEYKTSPPLDIDSHLTPMVDVTPSPPPVKRNRALRCPSGSRIRAGGFSPTIKPAPLKDLHTSSTGTTDSPSPRSSEGNSEAEAYFEGLSPVSRKPKEHSALSASSLPVQIGDEDFAQGRLIFRGRRARAAAAAAAAAANSVAASSSSSIEVGQRHDTAPSISPLKPAFQDMNAEAFNLRTGRNLVGRERSFSGFPSNRNLSAFSLQDTSNLSASATGLAERREEFSVHPQLSGKKSFTRVNRTDLGHLGHITAERKEKIMPQRKLTGLRSLRVRVSKLIRGNKPEPVVEVDSSSPHASVAAKVGRQLCLTPDAY